MGFVVGPFSFYLYTYVIWIFATDVFVLKIKKKTITF